MQTKHGFLSPFTAAGNTYMLTGALTVAGEEDRYTINAPASPQGFIDLALKHDLTNLWIVPEYKREMSEEEARQARYPGKDSYNFLTFQNKQTKLLSSIVGRRERSGSTPQSANVNIAYLSQSPWGYENLAQFTGLINRIESALGVPMKASPTSVGLRYLETIDKRYYGRYFADPEVDKNQLARIFKNAAKPLIWSRIPTAQELDSAHYLVAVDKRAAYPRAAMENMGIGRPEKYTGPFNHLFPGAWDVTVEGLENVDPRLPEALWDGWQAGTLATPVVKMLLSLGCKVAVKEAVIWRKTAPIFDRWAKGLWEARQAIPELKATMNNTLGFTVHGEETSDEKYRPDWYAAIVGYLRALMIYNAQRIALQSGLYPVGCYIDALYYLSPVDRVPGLSLAPMSMGGYAQKWAIPLTGEVRSMLTDPYEHDHFNMMLHKFNEMKEAA